ncbi:hypothetical protein ACJX0J_019981 [Zea mays]
MLELSCIASHLLWLGPFMADPKAQTPLFYIFRENWATGMRMMHNYLRIGGVAISVIVFYKEFFISGEEAVNWGLSGPMLRASGIQWDLRKIDPYESYNQFDWKVQWQKGDSLARYLVRVGEIYT